MTERERFIKALRKEPLEGLVPHFELGFFLTMEAFGIVSPRHRHYSQWFQMSENERELHRFDIASLQIKVAEKYDHSAIFLKPNPNNLDEALRMIELVREISGNKYYLMLEGDATFAIPSGLDMEEFSYRMIDEPDKLKKEAEENVNEYITRAEKIQRHGGLDGFVMCCDYCLNTGPFLSPLAFSEFVTPYLAKLIKAYRELGFYVIKHTDGNIMPILDQLIQANPHALHSIDPQAGVDIALVKKLVGDKVCLIGNVNCGLLQTGTDDEVIESARYALRMGMPGGGYIFSTSNCIYTGMPLKRYELMLKVWRREGVY